MSASGGIGIGPGSDSPLAGPSLIITFACARCYPRPGRVPIVLRHACPRQSLDGRVRTRPDISDDMSRARDRLAWSRHPYSTRYRPGKERNHLSPLRGPDPCFHMCASCASSFVADMSARRVTRASRAKCFHEKTSFLPFRLTMFCGQSDTSSRSSSGQFRVNRLYPLCRGSFRRQFQRSPVPRPRPSGRVAISRQ